MVSRSASGRNGRGSVEWSPAHEALGSDHPCGTHRGCRPPDPLRLHPGALRRVLALAEGRGAVHRRPPRRGRLPDRRGARAPREHLVARPSCASRRRSASRASPSSRARRARSTAARVAAGLTADAGGVGRAALLARPERVRDRAGRRPRQRRGDRAQGRRARTSSRPSTRSRGARRVLIAGTDQMAFFASYLRHLLMLLDLQAEIVASPSQEALSRLGRIDDATLVIGLSAGRPHPLVVRAMKLARHRKARHDRDHRRDAVRGRQARADPALLLVELAGLRALAHGAAVDDPGAGLRRLQPRRRAVRRPDQGLPPEVRQRPLRPYNGS